MVYVDQSKPDLVERFTKKTFTAMIEGVRKAAIHEKLIDQDTFDKGIRALYRTTEADEVFCVSSIIQKHGGQYLLRGGQITPLAGDWTPERIILIKFNTM